MVAETQWGELLSWLLRRRVRFQVSGSSMLPALEHGDQVLMDPHGAVQVGDIVVARHPLTTEVHLVKRLVAVNEGGRAQLEGLNARESTDTRTLGAVPINLVLGRVTSRF